MAKAKQSAPPGPFPEPKVGDTVLYTFPAGLGQGVDPVKGKVTAVYDGFDGRLVDLLADTGTGAVEVKSAPWRPDGAGNTWDWPAG